MEYANPQPFEQLESMIETWGSIKNVVGCSSGSAALHLALSSMNLPKGEVIVPDLTMIACARAVTLAGHTPIFVDCDSSLNMDPSLLGAAITSKTRAIMVVHLYGRRMPMKHVFDLAQAWRLRVIEDRAEFHVPFKADETPADAVCWSFYKNKVIHGEEGGAVAFPFRSDYAAMARSLRSLGFTADHDYSHTPGGMNYRLSNLHAMAIGPSIAEYGMSVTERAMTAGLYDKHCPPGWLLPSRECNWVYDLRIPGMPAATQDRVVAALKDAKIQGRHCFKPMRWQAEYLHSEYIKASGQASQSSLAAQEVIYLPINSSITEEIVKASFRLIRESL